jgi:putative endonuclease
VAQAAQPTTEQNVYSVYILQCADSTLYVGCTNDVARRVEEHNSSELGARYTKNRRPVVLKYTEVCGTRGLALRREAEIKSWTRAKKLELLAK